MKEFISEELMEETDNTNGLRDVLFSYLIYWKWFLLSVVLCLGAAWIYLRYATPTYSVSATVMIKDDKKGGRNSEAQALENMGFLQAGRNIENEVEILRSKSLIKEVVISQKIYASYTTHGRIGSRDLYTDSPLCVEMTPAALDSLKYSVTLEVVQQSDSSFQLTGNVGGQVLNRTLTQLPATVPTPAGILLFSRRQQAENLIGETIYIQISSPIQVAKAYLSVLTIAPTTNAASVVTLQISTTHRKRGEDFLNRLIQVYNQETNNEKNSVAIKTAQFINERILLINGELDNTEGELENFKRSSGLTNLGDAQLYVQENADYNKQSVDMGTQLSLMKYLGDYVGNPAHQDAAIPSNVGVSDANLTALIGRYNEQLLERNRLLRTSSEANPVIVQLNNSLTAMRTIIQSSIASLRHSLLLSRNGLDRQAGKFSARISNVPSQERMLTSIARQQEIKSGLYLMLLQKREENSIALAATADNAKIIDTALAGDAPIAPNYSLTRMLAFVVGLLIPIIVITLINFFRIRIESRTDVEKLTRIPIMGEVPLDSSIRSGNSSIVVKENENSLMAEVFRELRTNLQFIQSTPNNRVILVTSSSSGEGKTFVSCNLAVSLALLGKRVVIVGLDIRNPQLATTFGLETIHRPKGITHFLTQPDTDLHSLIVPSGINTNLHILLAGSIPPNPSELLARPALEQAIALLSSEYDYVILDSAPVGAVTDTLILARVAHTTVYLCRVDYSYKSNFEMINRLQKEKKLPEMSIVINGIDVKKKKYGYGYRHQYGKQYTLNTEINKRQKKQQITNQ